MLAGVFEKSTAECTVPIRFVTDGSQQNDVRDAVRELLKNPTLNGGRKLAARLRDVSIGKSGLGLLFLLLGQEGDLHKIVLSRFPAGEGVLAEQKQGSLEVAFVERIFMKNAKTYKAAVYKGKSIDAGFWDGYVIDRQISAGQDLVTRYWIRDFLASDFKTTSKAGSKRLAVALKDVSKTVESIQEKQEILAATTLMRNFYGKTVSIRDLSTRMNLSLPVRAALEAQVSNDTLLTDTFVLDSDEFSAPRCIRKCRTRPGRHHDRPCGQVRRMLQPRSRERLGGAISFHRRGPHCGSTSQSPQMTRTELESVYAARYENILAPLSGRLEVHLRGVVDDYPRIDRISVRPKGIARFVEKAKKEKDGVPKYSDPLNQIQDQIGARIVTFYLSDVDRLGAKIEEYFGSVEVQHVVPDSPQEFGYEGRHYILFIPEDVKDAAAKDEDSPTFFELQIKTLFQHAWGEADHDLIYKPSGDLTPDQRRRVAFTAAQAWGADRIFEELAQELTRTVSGAH